MSGFTHQQWKWFFLFCNQVSLTGEYPATQPLLACIFCSGLLLGHLQ